jgi:cobalt-zinc-cadmium efflux system outer membrane protein
MAQARRPDVSASARRVAQAETLTRLARREAVPDLGLGALLQREGGALSPRVGLQIELSIPVWNRNQGPVSQREADARRAALEREATLLAVRAEVTDAHQAYLAASEEEAVFADQALAPARRNQELLETAYREGEIDLPSLILLRNQLLDAEIGYGDAWLARRLSFTELEAAVGTTDFE